MGGVSIDFSGSNFGRWHVIKRSYYKHDEWYYLCRCECGVEKTVGIRSMRKGKSKSCGCLSKELMSDRFSTHGESNKTPEYRTWRSIKYRCLVPSCKEYKYYGARGITMCDRWANSFEAFLNDMGRRPDKGKYSIERVDVNKGYTPDNCKWADYYEQANNKVNTNKFEYKGEKLTLAQWRRKVNLTKNQTDYLKYKKGLSNKKIVNLYEQGSIYSYLPHISK